ncbi:hypothetical protein [Paenibacillus sp. J2TS4]|uniref:hypothetical protein n=1 Tax=Paenibacillus sp. J2TS4 TaxID=2807194 RepID=UPI001B18DAF8|nr:hypothetical protein [Paenibacillus sp. J2TS4]GIP31492.1 hypothetical protein J2TS4_07020 [Paenibacillus sp. J2TS4]
MSAIDIRKLKKLLFVSLSSLTLLIVVHTVMYPEKSRAGKGTWINVSAGEKLKERGECGWRIGSEG